MMDVMNFIIKLIATYIYTFGLFTGGKILVLSLMIFQMNDVEKWQNAFTA